MSAFLYVLAGVAALVLLFVAGAARAASRGDRAAEWRDRHRETAGGEPR